MTDFTVYINGKKLHRYHGFTSEGIYKLGEDIVRDNPESAVYICDDDNNIYFEYDPPELTEKDKLS